MSASLNAWLTKPQPHLGAAGLLALLVISSFITPLSLDMFTPSIPHMAGYFNTDTETVNLTLVGYYLFFALGMLAFGPLSDKYGRKPLLVAGLAFYTAGGILCALAPTIHMLIADRVVQAIGAGAISSVCMAAVKDSFEVDKREKILSIIQVLFVVGPAIAPIAGTAVLKVADWRATFWVLAAVGAVCLILSLRFAETLDGAERVEGGLAKTLGQLGVVGRNPGFASFLAIGSLFEIPFMAYIAVGSYIYIDFFGTGEVGYSLFFAAAAIIMAAGPLIWLAASKRVTVRRFTTALLALTVAVGATMLAFGHTSPYAFCACFVAFALAESCARPYSMNILLEQQAHDAGTASALMNCVRTGAGCIGMVLAVLPWPNFIAGVAVLMVVSMGAALAGWIALLRSRIPLACVKGDEPVSPL